MTLRAAPHFALALAGLALALPAAAQPAPPTDGPAGAMQDPFGDATILRSDAEAQAAARFAALDTDKDGSLSPEELAAGRPARPGAQAEAPRRGRGGGWMARMMDANGDGKISKDEFVTATLRRFDMADADHDGKLTKAERQEAMEQMRARIEAMRALGGGSGGGGDGPPPPGN